jgi:CubicO group peptidase (beta-lactamase class C family)
MQLTADALQERLGPLLEDNFKKLGDLGAAISLWKDGEPLLDLHGGFRDAGRKDRWTKDTIVLIWSATKGLASACALHLLQERRIDLERRVAEFWPNFAQAGKEKITLAQLLSHSSGLAALDLEADVLDYATVIDALEKQKPNWPPGTVHGYHARTFGFLLDELVRQIAGVSLGEYWRQTFAEPLKLDIWIGLPEKENPRVATIYAPKADRPPEPKQFYVDVATKGTFARKVFTSPFGLDAVSAMNKPEIRAQPIVSFGGIGSANSLAKFYAMLAYGGRMEGQQFFSGKAIDWMTRTLTDGVDRVFQIPTAFSAGFMKDSQQSIRRIFGRSASSFGHPGAGGSHAFADPENTISFAYVMNQMQQSVLPNERSLRFVDAIYQ